VAVTTRAHPDTSEERKRHPMFERNNEKSLSPIGAERLQRFGTINQTHAADTVSSKYSFIPTSRALAVLGDCGWVPAQVTETRTRKDELKGFQKHAIRLINPQLTKELVVGSTVPQILLTNSHAGTAAFELSLALYEKICSNGLLVARSEQTAVSVTHRGYADQFMESALRQIAGAIPETLEKTDRFKQLRLNEYEQRAFAEAAIDLRWDGEQFAVDPQDLLYTRRREEKEPTLWNTYNVIQEHLIKGGIQQRNVTAGSKHYGKTTRSRKVTGLDTNLQLNRALWTLTERMPELKAQ